MSSLKNRRCTPEERRGIEARIQQDTKFLSIIKEELDSRLTANAETGIAVQNATRLLQDARLRLSGAKRHQIHIEDSIKILKTTFEPEIQLSDISNAVSESPHLLALQRIKNYNDELVDAMKKYLQRARKESKEAAEAVFVAEETLQCAFNLHEFSGDIIPGIEKQINDIGRSISRKKASLKSIWEIPDEIWGEIFSLVVNDQETSRIQPCELYLMVLNDVCQIWRSIINSHPFLRSQITGKSWTSIETVTVSSTHPDDRYLFTSISSLLIGVHTLELKGASADPILSSLIRDLSPIDGHQEETPQDLPNLKKLILSDYEGDGGGVFQLADKRHIWLHSVTKKSEDLARAKRMNKNRALAPTPELFVKWHCHRSKLEVSIVRNQRGWHWETTIMAGGKTLGTAWATQNKILTDECFKNAADSLLDDDSKLWETFLQDVRTGKDRSERLFKVDLKNCTGISSDLLQELTPHR